MPQSRLLWAAAATPLERVAKVIGSELPLQTGHFPIVTSARRVHRTCGQAQRMPRAVAHHAGAAENLAALVASVAAVIISPAAAAFIRLAIISVRAPLIRVARLSCAAWTGKGSGALGAEALVRRIRCPGSGGIGGDGRAVATRPCGCVRTTFGRNLRLASTVAAGRFSSSPGSRTAAAVQVAVKIRPRALACTTPGSQKQSLPAPSMPPSRAHRAPERRAQECARGRAAGSKPRLWHVMRGE